MRMAASTLHAFNAALSRSSRLIALMRTLRRLDLRDAYVAAGAVRDTYWAQRHGFSDEVELRDVDVVFFDPTRSARDDGELALVLEAAAPYAHWDVTNQAHVHTWYTDYTGVAIDELTSSVEGIAMWPEVATCIGARLASNDAIEVVAPYGVDDLVAMRWRRNTNCPDAHAFARRVRDKRVVERFPNVRVELG